MKLKRNVIIISIIILLGVTVYFIKIVKPNIDATRLTPKEFLEKYNN